MDYSKVTVKNYVAEYAENPDRASRLLFSWLSDDHARELLYQDMNEHCVALAFESRALDDADAGAINDDGAKSYRQTAYLLAAKKHVEDAYTLSANIPNPKDLPYSNTPFQGLGGTFMLAIDEPVAGGPNSKVPNFKSHDAQRKYCYDALIAQDGFFDLIATVAFKMGALLPLKSRNFDLTALAEQVSIRYVALMFGFAQSDLPLLATTGRRIGKGLQYQMMGRHFVADPLIVPDTKLALGQVSRRAAELLDLYDRPVGQEQIDAASDLADEFDKVRDYWFEDGAGSSPIKKQRLKHSDPRKRFQPIMQRMAQDRSEYSTTEKAILVAGLVGGAVTNIRSAICIAIQQFFRLPEAALQDIRRSAAEAYLAHGDADWNGTKSKDFRRHVEEAMRVNPPAAFVPRKANLDIDLPCCDGNKADQTALREGATRHIKKGALIVIGVGGGAWAPEDTTAKLCAAGHSRFDFATPVSKPTDACPFSKVFGGPPDLYGTNNPSERADYTHSCFGKDFAMHVITHTARQVMMLPGLSQALDATATAADGSPAPTGLRKTWGYYCDTYPLEYQREKLLRQSPLQTVLPIKDPVPENAAALKLVLQYGVPFIEKVLKDARHVHFASFLFMENDSKLVLFTAYDGDFDAYIGHFAREFGPLFDRFFSHIEGGPPSPIAKHPFEFVQFLKRYQQAPAAGYFFSAYPEARVDQIQYEFNSQRKYDFFELGHTP